jgi:hypothetical protein
MEKDTLKKILNFLSENEGKNAATYGSIEWKILFNEPITKEEANIEGGLYLNYLDVTSLPEGLKVGVDLDLRNSYIESLPEGLEVGDELDLAYTYITSLPKGLKVGGLLIIIESDLLKYSDEEIRKMIEPGYIKKKIVREYYR